MSAASLFCNLASSSVDITLLDCRPKASWAVKSRSFFSSLGRRSQGFLPKLSVSIKKAASGRSSSTVIKNSGMDPESEIDRRFTGRVLAPAPGDSDWWDKKLLSGAVVVPEIGKSGYRMYYYGRGGDEWAKGVQPFNASLPTGRNGMAVSEDGLQFERYMGHLSGGAIMDPSPDYAAFDAVHIGVSDVLYDQAEDVWRMFYFGGGYEESTLLGLNPDKLFRGVKLRPGVAASKDGLSFDDREGPILELGEKGAWDENGVSWPRVLPPEENGDEKDKGKSNWLMTYHTRQSGGPNNFGFFSAGVATSADGKRWHKHSKILSAGDPGAWDEGDDGLVWEKDFQVGPEPGGPILKARVGENVWDNVIVGTPYVVALSDGSFRLYYLGVGKMVGDEASKQGIGLAVSDGPNYRSWRRFNE
uniref:Glycosyl hydrolase family 32 N-terminal domain-containing protein n=1 Tax=Physcomitrium patens TaxID=3218 RepID=A0A7I4AGY0_PHYPA